MCLTGICAGCDVHVNKKKAGHLYDYKHVPRCPRCSQCPLRITDRFTVSCPWRNYWFVFNQSRNFSILNLESEVIDCVIQYCDGILKTFCDSISQVNAGVAEVLVRCRLVRCLSSFDHCSYSCLIHLSLILSHSFIIDTISFIYHWYYKIVVIDSITK